MRARFTFASGNARAVLRLPAYLLGALACLVVPRTGRIWVFGCATGPGEGALPLYRLARERLDGSVRAVWLASTPAEQERARQLGLQTVLKSSARGLWLTLRARVLVVTHGLGDVNRYGVWGGFVVQLWHGIPLKRLHLDSPAALRLPLLGGHPAVRRLLGNALRLATRQIRLFPVASHLVAERIGSAFGLPGERIPVTGDPRDDILLADAPDQRRADALARLEAAVGALPRTARLLLYAPTWRDGERDPSAPDARAWAGIATWVQRHNAVLLVRAHPLARDDYATTADPERIRVLGPDAISDVNTVLSAVDVLITDYSSIAFDFCLTGGPILFLAPDVGAYTASHGLYEPYGSFSGGRHVSGWAQLLDQLDQLTDASSAFARDAAAHSRLLRERHFEHADGRATERVLAELMRRLS